MKSNRFNPDQFREPFHELTAGELLAVQGGGVDDFPWDALRKAINEFLGRPTNPMPGRRTICIPA